MVPVANPIRVDSGHNMLVTTPKPANPRPTLWAMRKYLRRRRNRHYVACKLVNGLADSLEAHLLKRGQISPAQAILIDTVAYQTILARIFEGYGLAIIDEGQQNDVPSFIAAHRDYINVCRGLVRTLEALGLHEDDEDIPELTTYIASKVQERDSQGDE